MNKKIIEKNQILPILEKYRSQNRKIVFTNGCFDILHAGHVYYLRECKKAGQILVVGLNTDHSVQLNKGPLRPIVPLAERAEIIAALEMVDHVVPFDEKTPYELINTLKPDILIKGADYTLDTIVGKNEVIQWGGKVFTIPLVEGKSTRNIIQTILERFNE